MCNSLPIVYFELVVLDASVNWRAYFKGFIVLLARERIFGCHLIIFGGTKLQREIRLRSQAVA